MCVTAFLILIIGLTNFWGFAYLVATKQSKTYTKSVCLGTIINFCINLILIPKLAALGAAIASISSEIAVLLYQTKIINKQIDLKAIYKGKIKYIFISILMWCIVLWLSKELESNIKNSIYIIAIGVGVYGGGLALMHDEYLFEIINKTKKLLCKNRRIK